MKNYKYIFIFVFTILTSCNEKTKTIDEDRYEWDAGFSAPKYYTVCGAKVSFGNAGCSNTTCFDNGWGDSYGAVSSAERFKKLPRTLTVEYASGVENLQYEGTVTLPYQKIEKLFKKHITNKETQRAYLIVGLAPGGWIRVWAYFSLEGRDYIDNIEIMKAQVKGHKDPTMAEGFTNKKLDHWAREKYYWDHFGIPLEAWAETEKEYNLFFNFYKPNPDYSIGNYMYSSLDGTLSGGSELTGVLKRQLPADLVIAWSKEKNDSLIGYDTHILMPKNFTKIVQSKKTNNVEILLEIEKNQEYGILYLITNNKKEKILRFKNEVGKSKGLGNSDFAKEITYYMQ